MTEKAWKGCGQKVGIKIWRIVKFKASINIFMLVIRQRVYNCVQLISIGNIFLNHLARKYSYSHITAGH